MSLTTSEMTPADIRACTCNNDGNDGMWGNSAWWIVILLLFGWGNGGFGGFGGGNALNGALTRADLCQDMNFGQLENGVRGIQQGICDSTFALNNSINNVGLQMMNGFHGVDNAICNLGFNTQQGFNATQVAMMQGQNALQTQLADCCCQTQRAIDGVNYNMATNTCNLQNTMNNNTRDIIDNANSNTRAILDYLCQDKISTLQQENQTLRLAASQSNQNATLMAAMDANTAEILRRSGHDCPTAAYVVQPPTPVTFPNGCGCGQTFSGCCGSCC